MEQFATAFSTEPAWQQAIDDCLQQLDNKTQGSTLGFVYVSDHFVPNLQAMLEALKSATNVADWVGTIGIGICASGIETYEQPAVSLMLTDIPAKDFRLFNPLDENLLALQNIK